MRKKERNAGEAFAIRACDGFSLWKCFIHVSWVDGRGFIGEMRHAHVGGASGDLISKIVHFRFRQRYFCSDR